jgi:hypothetical protein
MWTRNSVCRNNIYSPQYDKLFVPAEMLKSQCDGRIFILYQNGFTLCPSTLNRTHPCLWTHRKPCANLHCACVISSYFDEPSKLGDALLAVGIEGFSWKSNKQSLYMAEKKTDRGPQHFSDPGGWQALIGLAALVTPIFEDSLIEVFEIQGDYSK